MDELKGKLHSWKENLERKGLRVNFSKTKVMLCRRVVSKEVHEESGRFPCGMCDKGVGGNMLLCSECNKWVHGRCTSIKGKLERESDNFICKRCLESRILG